MNIGGIQSKITSNINKIGMLGGLVGSINEMSKDWYGRSNVFAMIQEIINGGLKNLHFPDLNWVITGLTEGYSSRIVKPALEIAILGEVLKYAGIETKYANLMAKGGWNAIKGSVIFELILHSTLGSSVMPKPKDVERWLGWDNPRNQFGGIMTVSPSVSWRYNP